MKKLLIGALAAAGLVFAGCERDVQGTRDDGMGGAGMQEAETYEPSLHPSPTGTGGAGLEGDPNQQPVQEDPAQQEPVIPDPELQEQDELQNQQNGTGGAGFEEDERNLEGVDGSGPESTMQDHTE